MVSVAARKELLKIELNLLHVAQVFVIPDAVQNSDRLAVGVLWADFHYTPEVHDGISLLNVPFK